MLALILFAAGGAVFATLGTLHLMLTFRGPKLHPYDESVRTAMQATTMRITRDTSLWNAWIGFNASHSLGAMAFGAFVLLLAIGYGDFLRGAPVFAWLAFANAALWLAVAQRYWFRIPRNGLALSTLCFLVAAVLLSVG
ncbi:MAG TPA: hypothetical protein VLF18_09510 [Tahibacter sp.]|uniref:LIC_13387 family protein n=1 Tax=Tahibacter sp. TaxID=2056211 RepID=UPI002C62E54C|nr:hypothetical protein [Tahibacter sp.]HSX60422.1 hypothetical protein [Tahibacter sp.]